MRTDSTRPRRTRWKWRLQAMRCYQVFVIAAIGAGWLWSSDSMVVVFPGLFLLVFWASTCVAYGRPRHQTVSCIDGADRRTLIAVLQGKEVDVVHLDGMQIHSVRDLAAALDEALGAFLHPEDPWQKTMAHIDHEVRGSGQRALVWSDASELAKAEPNAFQEFVREWRDCMTPWGKDWSTLYVDTHVDALDGRRAEVSV